MHFLESDINFFFESGWVVHRYDTHRYFKGLSGKGLKGVDFIGILHQESLVFFEVKNYNIRPSGRGGQSLDLVQNDPRMISNAFIRKIEDTFTAVDAIQKYWERRWWRRIFSTWISHFPINRYETAFWRKVIELAGDPGCCIAVLWLESSAFDADYRKKLNDQVSDELSAHCAKTIIADSRSNPFYDTLMTQV